MFISSFKTKMVGTGDTCFPSVANIPKKPHPFLAPTTVGKFEHCHCMRWHHTIEPFLGFKEGYLRAVLNRFLTLTLILKVILYLLHRPRPFCACGRGKIWKFSLNVTRRIQYPYFSKFATFQRSSAIF